MDEETERLIRQRAYALWEYDGRPEGRADEYWRRAEEEIMNQSVAGEEDPLAAVDDEEPGALASQIRR
jgi:Protein of unknown function (DUF2934)